MSPYRVDARMAGRHPFEIYGLFLALITSMPILLGIAPKPGTIREAMPGWLGVIWAASLAIGSLLALVGIYWRNRATGLLLEQVGLAAAGAACVVYGGVVLYVAGQDALISAALVGGFGAACLRRYFQIQEVVDDAVRASK